MKTLEKTICTTCKGTKRVVVNGKSMSCVACRGTGKAGGYLTK